MVQFQIKRGYKNNLLDDNNLPKIDLDEGCWYLTLDTAEVFVAIEVEGELRLYKINEAPGIDVEEFNDRFDKIESRLSALEENGGRQEVETFAEFSQFPREGIENFIYIALDKNSSYVYNNGEYICIGNTEAATVDIEVIDGGSATKETK